MSRATRIKLAEILADSGYQTAPILALVKYPACVAVQRTLPKDATAEQLALRVVSDGVSLVVSVAPDSGRSLFPAPVRPIDSHLEFQGKQTISFAFEGGDRPAQLVADGRLSVPSPPGWPAPKFLTALYPVAE